MTPGTHDIPNGPPEGWAEVRIASICQINPSKPPPDALPPHAPVTFVPMPAVDAEAGAITAPGERQFAKARRGSYTPFRDGDVLFAKITPCMENGKAAIARGLASGIGFGSTEFHVLRPEQGALADYVYHFIRQESFREEAKNHMSGNVGQQRVPVDFVKHAELPLPPTAEQKRIVAKVEELLTRVSAARERLAKLPAVLKRFRQAVLATACSGRLTEDWREQNPIPQGAVELLRRVLRLRPERFRANNGGRLRKPIPRDDSQELYAPPTWAMCSMDQLSCLVTSGSRGWAKYYADSGAIFIRAQNINTDVLRLDDVARVTPPDSAEGRRTRVQQYDLLITITGANVTKSAWVPQDVGEAYVSQHVALIRLVVLEIAAFLNLWTVSPLHGRAKLERDAYGAGKPGLNLDNIRETTVFLPPLMEQHEIVRRVEALFKLAAGIEERVTAAAKRAEKLTQAILAKAFRGELVPIEADLAQAEGREYEPASVLLERIRAEREARAPAKPARRRRAAPAAAKARPASRKGIMFRRGAVAAYVVARLHEQESFGRTMLEKALYLAQTHLGIDLDLQFKRQAAGPFDEMIYKLESLAGKQGWFTTTGKRGRRATYSPGPKIDGRVGACRAEILGRKTKEMDRILDLMAKMDTEQAELLATVYAAWNDLLLDGRDATDKAIIREVRDNWHERKQRFSADRITRCIRWLREQHLIPSGRGKRTQLKG